jgi:hypothetical protein
MSASINYRENYFQHPSLTKIHGDPTYSSLAKLEKECKANGKSVMSTLGGGHQGHLGLVSSIPAYERVSPGRPFLRPALPPPPTGMENNTQYQIAEANRIYTTDLGIFNACNLIERTILQQISTAISEECLANLVDDDTGLLQGTIPQVLSDLFDTYGSITPQSLAAAKAELESTTYDHSKPIVNVFTAISSYALMAEHANSAETPTQLLNIGIIIISRSALFSGDIRKWHDKPTRDKTWLLFKDHFQNAQRAIKKSQPVVTTDSLGYHEQANSASTLANQVMSELTAEAAAIEAIEQQAHQAQAQQAPAPAQAQAPANPNTALMDQMAQMQLLLSGVVQAQASQNNQDNYQPRRHNDRNRGGRGTGRTAGRGRGNGRGTPGNPRTARPPRGYCWTHGNCFHTGVACETPGDGHQVEATFANMLGGSQNRCHWL